MFCQKCGQQVPDGSTFCTHCGASLAGGAASDSAGNAAPGSAPTAGPGLTQQMPPVAPAPQKPKSRAPIIVTLACAAVALIGCGTVFALTVFNGSKSSDTQISVIDTGSSDEKDSSAKKSEKTKSKDEESSDDEAVPEDESEYYGSGDSDDYLTDVHTYTNDRYPYSISIPTRFEQTVVPTNSCGATWEDPETGFLIRLSAYYNANDETASEMLANEDTSGKTDLYTASDDNWYVTSWREGDTIIYEKTIVTDSTIATAHLEYSTANRDMGSKIIDTLLPTFQVD